MLALDHTTNNPAAPPVDPAPNATQRLQQLLAATIAHTTPDGDAPTPDPLDDLTARLLAVETHPPPYLIAVLGSPSSPIDGDSPTATTRSPRSAKRNTILT